MGRLLSARYTMIADFYPQITIRSEAGQITRAWDKQNFYTIQNRSEGIQTKGIVSLGSTEKWSESYEPVEFVKMYIGSNVVDDDEKGPVVINRTFRVSNIRDRVTGDMLWLNDNRDPIEFNVIGVTPVQDPFGRNVEFEITLKGVVSNGK